MNYQMQWVPSNKINQEHENLPITQIYCWLMTKDRKIALVSKDNQNWQFPGGKPEGTESHLETLKRELAEELSFDLEGNNSNHQLFGYYIVTELDESGKVEKTYLQVRYLQLLDKNSTDLDIHPDERLSEEESEKIVSSKWMTIDEAKQLIVWLPGSPELATFLELAR